MKKVTCKLLSAVAGIGFVVRRGMYTGDIDECGIIWLTVASTHRMPGKAGEPRRIGIHSAKFDYIEDLAEAPPAIDKRAAVNEQIRAANKLAATRAKA